MTVETTTIVTRPAPHRAVYTVPEAAALLGISRATAYVLLKSGELPARRIGSRWIIARRRFDAWLDGLPSDATLSTSRTDSPR